MDTLRIGIKLVPDYYDERNKPLYDQFGWWFTGLHNLLTMNYDPDSDGLDQHVDDIEYIVAVPDKPTAVIEVTLTKSDIYLLKEIQAFAEREFAKVAKTYAHAILIYFEMLNQL